MKKSQLTLDTEMMREQNDLTDNTTLQVDLFSDELILLSFTGIWGHDTARLRPSEARKIATALSQAANQAESDCDDSSGEYE